MFLYPFFPGPKSQQNSKWRIQSCWSYHNEYTQTWMILGGNSKMQSRLGPQRGSTVMDRGCSGYRDVWDWDLWPWDRMGSHCLHWGPGLTPLDYL